MYQKRTSSKTTWILNFFAIFFAVVSTSYASSPSYLTYSAKIVKPDGNPLEATRVDFRFIVQNAAGTCNVYSETFSNVNMSGTQGLAVMTLGAGIREFPSSGALKFTDVFDNTQTYNCSTSGTYTATSGASRQIVMQFNDGTGWQTVPAMQVTSVPYASYAYKSQQADTATTATNAASATTAANALTLNGYADTAFVMKSVLPTCIAGQVLFYNGSAFSCVAGAASGTVTSVTSANSYISVANTATTPVLTLNVGTTSNTVAAGNDSRITGALQASNNLSDLGSSATARGNLGLGALAIQSTVSLASQVSGTLPAANMSGANIITALGYTPVSATSTTVAISALTAATVSNTVNNANYPQIWNWANSTDNSTAFTFGESVAATNGTGNSQELVRIATKAGSTADPLHIVVNSNTTPVHALSINNIGNVAIGSQYPSTTTKLFIEGLPYDSNLNTLGATIAMRENVSGNSVLLMGQKNGASQYAWIQSVKPSDNIGKPLVLNGSGGDVGVGTTTPSYALDVSGTIRSTAGFQFPDGTVQTTAASGTGSSQWTTSGSAITYSSGYIGIGNTNPISSISLGSGTTASGGITFGGDINTNLYSYAPGYLRTDASLQVSGGITTDYFGLPYGTVFMQFYGRRADAGASFVFGNNVVDRNYTTGSGQSIVTNENFSPTSGNGTFSFLEFLNTINQTGGANGVTRGLYVNPTLTSAPNFRAIEMSNNLGYGLYQSGSSANNYFAGSVGIGTTSPAYTLDVSGTIRAVASSSASIPLIVKGASGQSASYMSVTDSAGSSIFNIANDKNIYLPAAGNIIVNGAATSLNASGLIVNSSGGITYTGTSNYYDTPDVALMRKATGLLEVNNGTLGQYRDLQVRSINPTTGNLGVGTSAPAYALDVSGTIRSTAGFRFPDGTVQTTAATGGGSVSGSGTTGKIPKWSSSSALTDSIMSESGTSLLVNGSISMPATTSSVGQIKIGTEIVLHNYGNANNFFGAKAGNFSLNVAAGNNIGIGGEAMLNLYAGYSNIGLGRYALYNNDYGNGNVAIGDGAGFYIKNGGSDGNIFIGSDAGPSNYATVSGTLWIHNSSGAPTIYGDMNNKYVGIGLTNPSTSLDIVGGFTQRGMGAPSLAPSGQGRIYFDSTSNTFKVSQNGGAFVDLVGTASSLDGMTDVITDYTNKSMYLGQDAGVSATTGSNNTSLGYYTLKYNTGAGENTAFGAYALQNNIGGQGNVAIGFESLKSSMWYDGNVSIGSNALTNISGSGNVAIGQNAGYNSTSGSNNILIGEGSNTPNTTDSYRLNIGNTIYGNLASGTVGIGIASGTAGLTVSAPVNAVGLQVYGTHGVAHFVVENSTYGEMFSIGQYGDAYVRYDRALHVDQTQLDSVGLTMNNAGAVMFTNGGNPWDPVDIMISRSIGGTMAVSGTMDVAGDVNATGVVRSNGVVLTSDRRYKKNIEPLQSSLDKLLRLRGVEYDWRTSEFPEKRFTSAHQIGLIAQEVEEIYPEAVLTDVHGYKGVNYAILVSPLIESVKELNNKCVMSEQQIQTLAEKVNQHSRDIASLKEELKSKETRIQKLEKQNELLMQRLDKIENLIRSK